MKKHGLSNTNFYHIYNNLNRRCNSPKNNRYYRYGARGIKNDWNNFGEFIYDMYGSYLEHCEKYGKNNTQIDRIDNDKNYKKENCRWVTLIEQARTRSNTHKIKINSEIKSLREWCKIYKQKYKTIFYRVRYKKMTPIDALELPIGRKNFKYNYNKEQKKYEVCAGFRNKER